MQLLLCIPQLRCPAIAYGNNLKTIVWCVISYLYFYMHCGVMSVIGWWDAFEPYLGHRHSVMKIPYHSAPSEYCNQPRSSAPMQDAVAPPLIDVLYPCSLHAAPCDTVANKQCCNLSLRAGVWGCADSVGAHDSAPSAAATAADIAVVMDGVKRSSRWWRCLTRKRMKTGEWSVDM